jgi:hypothetical protein
MPTTKTVLVAEDNEVDALIFPFRSAYPRIVGYNSWLVDFFATWERLQRLVLIE